MCCADEWSLDRYEKTFLYVLSVVLVGICIAGTFFRGLWNDEFVTLLKTQPHLSFRDAIGVWRADEHPPLYYAIVYAWRHIFYAPEWARLLNIIGVFLFIYSLARYRYILRRNVFLLFFVLSITSFGVLFYSSELRSYFFLIALSSLLLEQALRLVLISSSRSLANYVLLTFIAILVSLIHYFGFLWAMGAIVAAFGVIFLRERIILFALVGVGLIVAAVEFSWIAYSLSDISSSLGGAFWIKFEPLHYLWRFSVLLFSYNLAVILLVGIAICWRYRNLISDPVVIFSCVAALMGLLVAFVVSLHTPIVTHRNLLTFLPAALLVSGTALAEIVDRDLPVFRFRLSYALVVGICAVSLIPGVALSMRGNEDWSGAARILVQNDCAGKVVLTNVRGADYFSFIGMKDSDIPDFYLEGDPIPQPRPTCRVKAVMRGAAPKEELVRKVRLIFGEDDVEVVRLRRISLVLSAK